MSDHYHVRAVIEESIPAEIFRIRTERGISRAQLAEYAGLTEDEIKVLEDPNATPTTLERLLVVADALGVAIRVEFMSYEDFGAAMKAEG